MVSDAAEDQEWAEGFKTARHQRLPAARRRDQLIDAAIGAFGQSGFHNTSMDDVAEAAGVTKPVLYQHFPSKRQLYQELLETIGAELTEAVTSSATAETPHQQVLAGFRAYFRFVAERPSAFRLLFGTGSREDEDFTATIGEVEDRLASVIAAYISAGLDDQHRSMLGYAIVGLAEVTGRKWATGHQPLDPARGEQLAQQLAELVWAGLRGLPKPDGGAAS
jgi:AcrR family transcriptional regulator